MKLIEDEPDAVRGGPIVAVLFALTLGWIISGGIFQHWSVMTAMWVTACVAVLSLYARVGLNLALRIGLVVLALLALGIPFKVVYRDWVQDAPMRASAQAIKHAHSAALKEAQASFKNQGFKLTENAIKLNPSNASGTMKIWHDFAEGSRYETLQIRKGPSGWYAACPTTDPDQIYPLSANNNQLAIVLEQTGQCPAGLAPPVTISQPSN